MSARKQVTQLSISSGIKRGTVVEMFYYRTRLSCVMCKARHDIEVIHVVIASFKLQSNSDVIYLVSSLVMLADLEEKTDISARCFRPGHFPICLSFEKHLKRLERNEQRIRLYIKMQYWLWFRCSDFKGHLTYQ